MKFLLAGATLVFLWPAVAFAGTPEFVQAVRLFFVLQDASANGESRASAMQGEWAARAIEAAGDIQSPDAATIQAAAGFILAGGPADLGDALLRRADLPVDDIALLKAIVAFKNRQEGEAAKAFAGIDPFSYPPSLGGRIALSRALVLPDADVTEKLSFYDTAIQLMPGTLVEDSSLRRAALTCAALPDQDCFFTYVSRYFRRFARSPFIDAFLSALGDSLIKREVARKPLDMERLDWLLTKLPAGTRREFFLELARNATAAGLAALAAFSASRAGRLAVPGSIEAVRAELYANVPGVSGPDYEVAQAQLTALDAARLTEDDRSLLDAALQVSAFIHAPASGREAPANIPAEHLALVARGRTLIAAADALLNGEHHVQPQGR
ncbi:hypothetical protein [Aestuariivirga sp.]|uniref:hypothetical protein n=1 Tax=Aestuariivirga sp. TaxID=2650926 RepID=UPI0039E33B18